MIDKIHAPEVAGEHVSGYAEPGYRPPLAIPTDQIPGATHTGGKLRRFSLDRARAMTKSTIIHHLLTLRTCIFYHRLIDSLRIS